MRTFLISTGAALLALAATATPAYAQFGGSPDQQVDAPAPEPRMAAPDADPQDPGYAEDQGPDDQGYDTAGKDEMEAAGPGDDSAYQGGEDDSDQQQAYQDDAEQPGADDAYEGADKPGEGDAVYQGQGGPGETWQGEDGQSYCRRSDGTTGLVVGGGAGALVGRGIDGGRNRAAGTIIGGVIGAIIGSAVERNANQQRCQ